MATTRVISSSSLVRDLGMWREDNSRGSRPAYIALAEGIRLLVHDGRIPLGVALPSERDLAAALELSRTTVTSTYALLRERGYLRSRQGSRSTVALPAGSTPTGVGFRATLGLPGDPIDMTHAAMDAPDGMAEAYQVALQSLPAYLSTHGMEPVGIPVLREAIAARYSSRGVPTDPDQILVTIGAQHALRLVLAVLAAPGERVLIEHPTYPNAIEAIRSVGARPVPVALRPEDPANGWDLDGIRSAARQTAARAAYLTPDFNNPTGLLLDDEGRAELAVIARETRMTIIVDESMADLALDGEIPTPTARFARNSDVITLGSASKSFWGGLRVGWIRAPRSLLTTLLGTRVAIDLGTPIVDQLAAAHLLENGDAMLAQRCDDLRARRATLARAVAEHLTDWQLTPSSGGMSTWAQLPASVSTALAATAPNHGVLLAAGPRFGVQGAFERYLRLPYARPEAELYQAVELIAQAYHAITPRPSTPLAPLTVV